MQDEVTIRLIHQTTLTSVVIALHIVGTFRNNTRTKPFSENGKLGARGEFGMSLVGQESRNGPKSSRDSACHGGG